MKPQSKLMGHVVRDRSGAGYSRGEVLRILHLTASQLAAWERAGLIPLKQHYNFGDLGPLRMVRDLRATRVPAKNILASVRAMQRLGGVANPLIEASAVRRGFRVDFRHAGRLVDPITQQLAFDFDAPRQESQPLLGLQPVVSPLAHILEVQEMFQRAVQFEENPSRTTEAAQLYREILAARPEHAPAAINLGTIHYNLREFDRAEELYRQATVADPEYALAFFDLGNVLDEKMRLLDAITAYERAVALVPQYADAHYNLALAYERQGERRRSLRHWLIYARLDPVGPWASHAKCQARKILSTERLSIVSRRGKVVPIAG